MNKLRRLLTGLLLIAGGAGIAPAQTLDPAFAPPSMYAPGIVISAVEQPDGKRVVTGLFNRVDGTPAWGVSRFNTNGTLDAAFQQNVGPNAYGYRIRLLSNGQFFLMYPGLPTAPPITAGGISRQAVLRLNADGTGDASFDPGTGPDGFVDDVLPLPNGQAIVVGAFNQFNGTAAHGIVRLNANGTVDATFNSGTGAALVDDIERIIPLPNGQFLASGGISSYNGVPRDGLIRLNADGSLDQSFVSAATGAIDNVVLQPDGRILIAGILSVGTNLSPIARLMPNGAYDSSFTPPALPPTSVTSRYGDALQLQPDGKVIVLNAFPSASGTLSSLVRLNANGTLDPSFQVGTQANAAPSSVTLLANGNVLLMGGFAAFSGVLDRPLVQLTSTGAVDPAFQPLIQTTGSVRAVVRQADGKLVAGGNFSQINGQPVRRLARFNADGTLDTTFPTNPGLDTSVLALALQADGNILAITQTSLNRFLPTGSPDNNFTSPNLSTSLLTRLLLQADGRILIGGSRLSINGTTVPQGFARLLANGSIDATFAPASTGAGRFTGFQAMAQQPDGKLLIAGLFATTAGTTTTRSIMRLQSTGALDASFMGGSFTAASGATAGPNSLVVQPDGKILMGGLFTTYAGSPLANVGRLNTDGTLDTGFAPAAITGTVNTLLLQPNNRILVGGTFTGTGLPANFARLLPTGAADATFGTTAIPNSTVYSMLVQPDGKLVLGGAFASFSSVPSMGVARLAAANVLHVSAPQAVVDRTEAWPVPAHTILNVAPDASAHAQALDLVDALGRPVQHLALTGAASISLPLENLQAGIYLLRVTYREGIVVRRIQVQ